jgi:signal peptidase II
VNKRLLPKIGLALTAAAITAADQLSKYAASTTDALGWPWPGIFEFTIHHNHGLIANLAVPQPMIIALTLAVIIFIIHKLFVSSHSRSSHEAWALALVLGGALGNLIDRLLLGYVNDWMMFFGTSIVNLADAAIACGLLWYIVAVSKKPQTEKG